MVCPLYTNRKVFNDFNKIVKALGGKEMTEEEFRDSALRNQRTGSDFAAMEAAYRIWNLNNGESIDYAPNGSKSILFQTLLDLYNGDVNKAIQEKSLIYSKSFRDLFGDWINDYQNLKEKLDANGEPLLSNNDNVVYDNIHDIVSEYVHPFQNFNISESFGTDVMSKLISGETVSSKEIIESSINNGLFVGRCLELATILSKHDVPIRFSSKLGFGVLGSTIVDDNGGSVVLLNSGLLQKVSNRYAGEAILHEMVHAVISNALSDPKTTEQATFKKKAEKIFNILRKAVENDKYLLLDTQTGLYALTNVDEFAAVFMTNDTARQTFYDLAKQIDDKLNTVVKVFKSFVNSIFRLFVNKNIFENNVEQLHLYDNMLNNYINNKSTIQKGNILSDSELSVVYDNIGKTLDTEAIIDKMLSINNFVNSFKRNNLEIHVTRRGVNVDPSANKQYDYIKNTLQSRINAVRSSKLSENVKQDLIRLTTAQIGMFENPEISRYEAIGYIVNSCTPYVLQSLEDLRNIKSQDGITLESSNYVYQCHDNIGMFESLFKSISIILENDEECNKILDQYNKGLSDDDKISKNDIVNLLNDTKELSSQLTSAYGLLKNILNKSALNTLQGIVEEAGSLEGKELIENLDSENPMIEDDINWFELQFGQADASTNEIVRAMAHLISKADYNVHEKVKERGKTLLYLQDALKSGESVKDLYEMIDGKATGYIVRDRNFGKFENDYRTFLSELNKQFNLPEDNTQAPNDYADRVSWNNQRNEWLDTHCDRKYNKKYYNAWAKVPVLAKIALDNINGAISAIIEQYNVLDGNGIYHYDRITKQEDWETIQRLWISKKMLRSKYDEFGNEKTGESLKIAEALELLYSDLYGKDFKEREKQIDKWKEARNEIIKQCGGQQKYDDYLRGVTNNFDFKKLDEWDARNSKKVFKKNKNGEAIVFDLIEQEMLGQKIQYGSEYEELKKKANELLRPYYDLSGEVNDYFLPDSVKNLLNNVIYKRMAEIRKNVIKTHPGYSQLQAKYGEVFNTYLKLVDTRYYKKIQNDIMLEIFEDYGDVDFELYSLMLGDYGNSYIVDGMLETTPFKWLQRIESKNPEFMDIVPNNGWQEQEEDSSLLNKKFDSSYNSTMVPKKKDKDGNNLYDNSEQYNKIINSDTLSALYHETIDIMRESNSLQTNRNWSNEYRLPGITASLYEKLLRHSMFKWWSIFSQFFKELIGYTSESNEDVVLRNQTTVNDLNDEEGHQIYSNDTRVIGRHPDGTPYTALPQYYTRRLKHPEDISYQLVDMLVSYYKMSLNYSEKLKIRDTCEGMYDYLKTLDIAEKSVVNKVQRESQKAVAKLVGGDTSVESNISKQLRNTLDLALYNKVRKEYNIGKIQMSAVFSTVQKYTSAINLGLNPKVAAVGFMTATHAHLLNGLVGKEYNTKETISSSIEALFRVIIDGFRNGLDNRKSKDKVRVIMGDFGIAGVQDRMYKYSNKNWLTRAFLNHHTFGFLATADYLSKSLITIACLKNYRYIDGKFYSTLDIQYMKDNDLKYREMMYKYKKAKTLYDLIEIKDGNIFISDENARRAYENDKERIRSKCVKQTEKADGVATGIQRAAIQQSWIGMLIMIHRQFMPLMLHERLGKRVYDYDTQEYTHGQFRVLLKYVNELCSNSILGAFASGATGFAFFGLWGALAGALYGIYKRANGIRNGKNLSISELNNKFFNNFNTQKDTINSVENKYAMRQIAFENLLYFLVGTLIVNPVNMYADDDRNNWFLQTLAYWLKASSFEVSGPYNTQDLISTIKSPTAATSGLDKLAYVGQTTTTDAIRDVLYGLSLTEDSSKNLGIRSPYGGYPSYVKAFALLFPAHNLFEQSQAKGVRGKNTYLKRQMLHEKSGHDSVIFDWFKKSNKNNSSDEFNL